MNFLFYNKQINLKKIIEFNENFTNFTNFIV